MHKRISELIFAMKNLPSVCNITFISSNLCVINATYNNVDSNDVHDVLLFFAPRRLLEDDDPLLLCIKLLLLLGRFRSSNFCCARRRRSLRCSLILSSFIV